jgi:signal peptidase I
MNRPKHISFILLLLIILIFKAVIFEFYSVTSTSMADTLLQGDFILVNKLIYGTNTPNRIYFPFMKYGFRIPSFKIPRMRDIRQGEIVVVSNDNYPGCANNIIKRVAAVEGQSVTVVDDLIFVDGVLINKTDLTGKTQEILVKDNNSYDTFFVPENMLYILGDNFVYSYDSRDFGFVDEKDVIGKAVLIYASKDTEGNFRWDRFLKKPQ